MYKKATRKSHLLKTTQLAAAENTQPENCGRVPVAAPAQEAWVLSQAKLWWNCRTQLLLPALSWKTWLNVLEVTPQPIASVCVPMAHPEVDSERFAANQPRKICLLPLAVLTFMHARTEDTDGEKKQSSRQTFKASPWVLVAAGWKQKSVQQCCSSGGPVEFLYQRLDCKKTQLCCL